MENDLISRHAAIELIERMKPYHQEADDIAEMIANMPSAQPDVPDTNVSNNGDTIYRQDAIDAVDKLSDEPIGYLEAAIDALVDLPSAQPEIIACGDCKHWICHDRRCGYWNHGVKPLEWCCHAERRSDE